MEQIGIIDYGAGNLRSVQKAFEFLGHQAQFVTNPAELDNFAALVFPGQGASPPAMAALRISGMDRAIVASIDEGKPFFGVCLGLQLLLDWSEEGDTKCLGIVPGSVPRFQPGLKVPHMGWNTVNTVRDHPIFDGLPPSPYFYFVHSYYAVPDDESCVTATTDYGVRFASAVAIGNVIATQFHPEKSGKIGLHLYDNFAKIANLGMRT